jgi:polar amino acid transport system substrate-binding protein
MMKMIALMVRRCALASALLVLLSMQPAQAETITVAVEDKDWTPYYVWEEGEPRGPCSEIAAGAIRHMGAEVEFVRVPWVRVLLSVERQTVDAGLCGTKNDERAAYSHYPEESLLSYDATLFVHADSPLESSDVSGLKGKTFGSVKGYTYGDIDKTLEAQGLVRLEANSREALFKLLIRGRLDMMLDSILPTISDARKLGVETQIRPLEPSLSETPAYLFFSQKPGHDELAKRFSAALKEFKETDAYSTIEQRYGL